MLKLYGIADGAHRLLHIFIQHVFGDMFFNSLDSLTSLNLQKHDRWIELRPVRHEYVYIHTYIHACMLACMHTYIHTYMHMRVCVHNLPVHEPR